MKSKKETYSKISKTFNEKIYAWIILDRFLESSNFREFENGDHLKIKIYVYIIKYQIKLRKKCPELYQIF